MEKYFTRHLSSLKDIDQFVHRFTEQSELDQTLSFQINLAIEELFTNMIKYNPNNNNDILIRLCHESEHLKIELVDFDVDRFDIRNSHGFDPNKPMNERRRGGMGLHLIQNIMNKVEYDYHDRRSTITLIKNVETENDRHPN